MKASWQITFTTEMVYIGQTTFPGRAETYLLENLLSLRVERVLICLDM